jgi:hypothetical protein
MSGSLPRTRDRASAARPYTGDERSLPLCVFAPGASRRTPNPPYITARTALEVVLWPLLSTSDEPLAVVSTRVTAAVT